MFKVLIAADELRLQEIVDYLQKYLIEENLTEKSIYEAGLVDYSVVKKYIRHFFQGRHFYSSRLWALIMLHMWVKSGKEINS